MMWTYRVFRDKSHRYSVREVFYEQDGTVVGYGKSPVAVVGDNPNDLIQQIAWLRDAFELPILSIEATDAHIAAHSQTVVPRTTVSLHDVQALLATDAQHDNGEHVLDDTTKHLVG